MQITCRSCSYDNPEGSGFCLRCGQALSGGGAQQPSSGSFQFGAMGGQAQQPGGNQQPTHGLFPTGTLGGQAQQQQMYSPSPAAIPQPSAVAPAPSSMGSLRRAFAGHGTLIMHHSWLLDGRQAQVKDVRQAIFNRIMQRNVDGTKVSLENLTDQGVVDEHRDYIKVRRKSATVFIYASPAGQDLYISRATTVQPGLSLLRVIVFGLILLTVFLPWINLAGAAASGSGSAIQSAAIGLVFWGAILLFFSLPLLWVLAVALARSIASLALDKDFWVLLRPNKLTEFQRDEIAMMEHTTDNVVREAMKQLGLDADKITSPPTYQPKERIRLI